MQRNKLSTESPEFKRVVNIDKPFEPYKRTNWRKLAYIPYSIVLVLQWLFVLLQNLMEVVANGFEEIVIALREYLHPDEEKPVLTTDKENNPG